MQAYMLRLGTFGFTDMKGLISALNRCAVPMHGAARHSVLLQHDVLWGSLCAEAMNIPRLLG